MAIVYQLITADGVTFNLSGSFADGGYSVGSPPYVPDGVGFPPIKHIVQDIYNMPGSLLQDIQVRPRIVDIPIHLWGNDVGAMLDARSRLINVLRWDRSPGSPPDPATLRITVDGVAADLSVYYLSDISSTNRRAPEHLSVMGIRLIAYDPLWRSTSTTVTSLTIPSSATVKYLTGVIENTFELVPAVTPSAGDQITCMAIHPFTGDLYIGGAFTNWDGVAGVNYIVIWDGTAYSSIPTPADINASVHCMTFAPDGTLYIGGQFTNVGGDGDADYIAQLVAFSSSFQKVGGPAESWVNALLVAHDGLVYAGGSFADMNSIANTQSIARWDGTDWTAMGTGADGTGVSAFVEGPDHRIYAGGSFNVMGGVADTATIAVWSRIGAFWATVGATLIASQAIYAMIFDAAGTLYVTGSITAFDHIASWNGSVWLGLGEGLNNFGRSLVFVQETLYIGGVFTTAGGMSLAQSVARWDGSSWKHIPITLPGTPSIFALALREGVLYLGGDQTGTAFFPGTTDIAYAGSVSEYPVITVFGEGTLNSISNEDSGEELLFDLYIASGEGITIDLSPGVKSVESNFYGNRLSEVLPQSSLNTFSLLPDPLLATPGSNRVVLRLQDSTVAELSDDLNQLTVLVGQITGLTTSNTDASKLYITIVDDGGGFFHVDTYSNAARTALVAHTGTYNGGGDEVLIEDNDSGLGGTITIDAAAAADIHIVFILPFIQFEYYNKFWSLEGAVN